MRRVSFIFLLIGATATLAAQDSQPGTTAAGAPGQIVQKAENRTFEFKDEDGDSYFSYGYPSDWTLVDSKPIMPVIKQKVEEGAASSQENRVLSL